MELLKNVQSKNDLIIWLVAHDIEQDLESNIEEGLMSDEDEVALREVIQKKYLE